LINYLHHEYKLPSIAPECKRIAPKYNAPPRHLLMSLVNVGETATKRRIASRGN